MNADTVATMLRRHEGVRLKPYRDTVGKLTIGVGRNLTDVGLSSEEVETLLAHDIQGAWRGLTAALPWIHDLDESRQHVLLDMAFNLGLTGLLGFKHMLAAVEAGDFATAATEMLASGWATQVGTRAAELAAMMEGA